MGKVLVVAEKPSVGLELAKHLQCNVRKDGYIEGDRYIVTWAIGHLIGLKYPEEHDQRYKKWSLEDLPLKFDLSDSLKILPGTKKQFEVINRLINREDIESIINAGDAGREGYLIQSWIYRMANNKKPVKVLWASSFTDEAIEDAFNNLKDDSFFSFLLQEAEARAEADHFVGINYSRALGVINNRSLAYGRCQTPLLKLIVDRDTEIENFISTPFYNVQIEANTGQNVYKALLVTETRKRADLEDIEATKKVIELCENESGIVINVSEDTKVEHPPLLYNLAALQKEMGKKYGYTPDKTLKIAQTLYEEWKVLSYPRTESQYLSTDLYNVIGDHLNACSFGQYAPLVAGINIGDLQADKRYFNDHKVTDHYALIPTDKHNMETIYNQLNEEERNVFNAVLIRFISIFYPDYIYKEQEILMNVHNFLFLSKSKCDVDLGYKRLISSDKEMEESVPFKVVNNGEKIKVQTIELLEKKTSPPKHYTVDTLISVMEKYGIGTAATRADIIQKLQKPERQFIKMEKKAYICTELGKQFISLIPDKLKSTDLTQKFEAQLEQINSGDLGKEEFLSKLYDEFIKNLDELQMTEKKLPLNKSDAQIGSCPICGHAMREGEKNFYCSNYKNGCKYSLGKKILGKTISTKQVSKLLKSGKTDKIEGFISKQGNTFAAKIELDEQKKIKFIF